MEGIQLDDLQDLVKLESSVMQFKPAPIVTLTYM